MKTYVVDTHALTGYLDDDPRLGSQAEAVLDNADVRLIIPAFVLAEIKYLGHKGRLTQTLDEVLRVINSDPRCTIYPRPRPYPLVIPHNFSSSATQPKASSSNLPRVGRPFSSQPAIP